MKKQTDMTAGLSEKGTKSLPEPVRREISLEELSRLCQDDTWMEEFIEDTRENHMCRAPFHMKEEVLRRQQHQNASSRIRFLSPRMQLLRYSLQVSAAAVGAIILLFSWPPAVGTSRASGRPYRTGIEQSAESPRLSPGREDGPPLRQKWKVFDFSDSINSFSIEFFNREVTPND